MKQIPPMTRACKPGEQGYVLLAVMLMLALLIIAMAVATPKIAKDIQRDRELETMHRGLQYRRAIQLYYRKFNAYPPNVISRIEIFAHNVSRGLRGDGPQDDPILPEDCERVEPSANFATKRKELQPR